MRREQRWKLHTWVCDLAWYATMCWCLCERKRERRNSRESKNIFIFSRIVSCVSSRPTRQDAYAFACCRAWIRSCPQEKANQQSTPPGNEQSLTHFLTLRAPRAPKYIFDWLFWHNISWNFKFPYKCDL
jgi:hypothetical protein